MGLFVKCNLLFLSCPLISGLRPNSTHQHEQHFSWKWHLETTLRWATPELQPKISFQIDATRACFVRTPARCPNASRNSFHACNQHYRSHFCGQEWFKDSSRTFSFNWARAQLIPYLTHPIPSQQPTFHFIQQSPFL